MKNGVMHRTCRRAVTLGCERCPLAQHCDQEGFLPGKLVIGDGNNPNLKEISALVTEWGYEVREVLNDEPKTRVFVLA